MALNINTRGMSEAGVARATKIAQATGGMVLSPTQIKELDVASARNASGHLDQSNIDYAKENFGYSYNPGSVITSENAQNKTEANQAELDRIKAQAEANAKNNAGAKDTLVTDTGTAEPTEFDLMKQDLDAEVNSVTSQLDSMAALMDEQSKMMIENIKANYARRKTQQETINKNALQGQTKLGIRSGRQRYANEVQTGILSAEESAGIERLADLDREEQGLILQAQMANTEKQFELLNTRMNQLSSLRKEKQDLMMNQLRMAADNERLAMERAKENREVQKYYRTEAESKAESIAPIIFNSLGTDAELNEEMVQSLSEQYGIDFNVLGSKLAEYEVQQKKDNLNMAKINFDISQDIPAGEQYYDPSTGLLITGTKEPEMLDITRTVGNMEYKVRYDMSDPTNPQEVFSIPLGPKYKTGSGGGSVSTNGLSGNFSESYLMQRTADFLNEDGSVDWLALDQLSDKTLRYDLVNVLSNAQNMSLDENISNMTTEDVIAQEGSIAQSIQKGLDWLDRPNDTEYKNYVSQQEGVDLWGNIKKLGSGIESGVKWFADKQKGSIEKSRQQEERIAEENRKQREEFERRYQESLNN